MKEIKDFGPIYAETNVNAFPVELFNTFSNVVFLLILIYWFRKTKLNFKTYPFISFALPVLAVGFLGGTIYHATRSHNIWLILDFMPIMILCLAASFRFWQLYFSKTLLAFFATLLVIVSPRMLLEIFSVSRDFRFVLSYSGLAVGILLPAYLLAYTQRWANLAPILIATISFIIAISFRTLDHELVGIFPMGTHWLWHFFGGISTHFLILFAYRSERDRG